MALEIQRLVARVTADVSQYKAGMASVESTANKTFASFQKISLLAGAAILAGTGMLAKQAIGNASDLEESLNKSNEVFGRQRKQVEEWSTTTTKGFGQSQRATLEYASGLGAILKPMGFTEKATAKMSQRMTELVSDISSFNNISQDEAFSKMASGIVGQSKPLRIVGIDVSALRVATEALSMTGKKSATQLTAQEKAMARYNLIMKDSKIQQGDYARTSSGVANATRTLSAQWENASASIGKMLLPAVQTFLGVLNRMTGFLSENAGFTKILFLALTGLGAVLLSVGIATKVYGAGVKIVSAATKIWAAVQWLLNAALTANPIGLVIVALVAFGAALALLWMKSETFRKIVTAAWEAIKNTTLTVFNFLKDFFMKWWPLILIIATGGIGLIVVLLIKKWTEIKTFAIAAFNFIKDFFVKWWPLILIVMTAGVGLIAVLLIKKWGEIKAVAFAVWNAVRELVVGAFNAMSAAGEKMRAIITTIWKTLAGVVSSGVDALVRVFQPVLTVLGAIADAARIAGDAIRAVIDIGGKAKGAVGGVLGRLPGFAEGGRVSGGSPIVVGEKGPELFVPGQSGRIVPNSSLGSSGGSGVGFSQEALIAAFVAAFRQVGLDSMARPLIGEATFNNDVDPVVIGGILSRRLAVR